MTQLGLLYEKEKIEYSNQKVKENSIKERSRMAKSMLDEGIDFIKVMKITGMTEEELLRLQNENVTI